MVGDRSAIAIIPARGGSRGLPGKNVRDLCGKPLIAWTIETARKSAVVDEVVVTTDSSEIADVARRYGASVPFLRPEELATDAAPTIAAVDHALGFYAGERQRRFDYTVLLEPTSPLREDDDVDRMLRLLDERRDAYDAIVSLGEVAEHPSIVKRLRDHVVEPFCPELAQHTRRQDNESAWFPYGVAYVVKTAVLLAERTFYPSRCLGFPIRRYQNYEIDSIYDFVCVEAIMRHMGRTA
jgi:CMP-N,N'-diacetyllegionaminic acid synthase